MIQVFKFGGASVQDANSIKNVSHIISKHSSKPLLVVVSALGKTTNAIEKITQHWFKKDTATAISLLHQLKQTHLQIIKDLELDETIVDDLCKQLEDKLNQSPFTIYDFYYDQMVSFGELLSTTIVAAYLQKCSINAHWTDARTLIKTDANYRDVNILWTETEKNVTHNLLPLLNENKIIITQGFIGSTKENFSTTLGREGSDYSASIFSYCLNAESMSIWKDVPGVMNADPKQFADAEIISELSYYESIEMTFYGAKVIHPKTIKPIQNKKIPLHVRSFIDSDKMGTTIFETDKFIPYPAIKVLKENQVLMSIQTRDFSFIGEKHLQKIFEVFATYRIRMNVMQNGAISFSCCVDANDRINEVVDALHFEFKVLLNEGLELATIRHYNDSTIAELTNGKEILVEQKSRHTIQFVLK
jgi:aspartate kinase